MLFRIREVDAEDEHETLTELHQQTFLPGEAPMADFTEGHWWIAFWTGRSGCIMRPVAFLGIIQSNQGDDVGYFKRVGVLPEYRGYGLQTRLMRAMHNKARRVGWSRIVTDTRENPHSANNIIRAGYYMFEPVKPWALAGTLYWTKDLT